MSEKDQTSAAQVSGAPAPKDPSNILGTGPKGSPKGDEPRIHAIYIKGEATVDVNGKLQKEEKVALGQIIGETAGLEKKQLDRFSAAFSRSLTFPTRVDNLGMESERKYRMKYSINSLHYSVRVGETDEENFKEKDATYTLTFVPDGILRSATFKGTLIASEEPLSPSISANGKKMDISEEEMDLMRRFQKEMKMKPDRLPIVCKLCK